MGLIRHLKNVCPKTRSPSVRVPEGPDTPPVRRRCRFSGSVQGVGFRYEARLAASQLSLTGWVQNESDGTVLLEIEGSESRVGEFLRAMGTVPRFHLTNVEVEDLPPSGAETSFRVRY